MLSLPTQHPFASGLAVTVGYGLFYYRNTIYQLAIACIKTLVTHCFYVDFKTPTQLTIDKAQKRLTELNAQNISVKGTSIEAVYIRSMADVKANSVMVMCLNTNFYRYMENTDKRISPYLNSGIDVVLWNPTQLTPMTYSRDSQEILTYLYQENPARSIVVYSYCASSDPSIKAVHEFTMEYQDAKVGLICDRGHGNVMKLAESMAFLARWPIVRNILRQDFDCEGETLISDIAKRVLFLSAENRDQLMQCKEMNLTDLLYNISCQNATEPPSRHVLPTQDHWSDWSHQTFAAVFDWLKKQQLISDRMQLQIEPVNYPEPSPTWFNKTILPRLVKLGGC